MQVPWIVLHLSSIGRRVPKTGLDNLVKESLNITPFIPGILKSKDRRPYPCLSFHCFQPSSIRQDNHKGKFDDGQSTVPVSTSMYPHQESPTALSAKESFGHNKDRRRRNTVCPASGVAATSEPRTLGLPSLNFSSPRQQSVQLVQLVQLV